MRPSTSVEFLAWQDRIRISHPTRAPVSAERWVGACLTLGRWAVLSRGSPSTNYITPTPSFTLQGLRGVACVPSLVL